MKNIRVNLLASAILLASTFTIPANVVINEIFYNAPDDIPNLEWIEIHNTADKPVNLSGWQFNRGIKFTFPDNTSIAAKEFVVLTADAKMFEEFYAAKTSGEFSGGLSNSGETVTLVDESGKTVDSVSYKDAAPWPVAPDGYSASLERVFPAGESEKPQNWASSTLPENERVPSGSPGARNTSFATTTPPAVSIDTTTPKPHQPTVVEVEIEQGIGIKSVHLGYRIVGPGHIGSEKFIEMKQDGARYRAAIPTQGGGSLIRHRIRTLDGAGNEHFCPHAHSLRPSFTSYVLALRERSTIPLAFIVNTDLAEMKTMNGLLKGAQKVGNSPWENRGERRAMMQIVNGLDLSQAFYELTINEDLSDESLSLVQKAFIAAESEKLNLFNEVSAGRHSAAGRVGGVREKLRNDLQGNLTPDQLKKLNAQSSGNRRARNPQEYVKNLLPIESNWLALNVRFQPTGDAFVDLRNAFLSADRERNDVLKSITGRPRPQELMAKVEAIKTSHSNRIGYRARRYLIDLERSVGSHIRPNFTGVELQPPSGRSAFVVIDPEIKKAEVFDFVNVSKRSAGYKVRFHKDKKYKDMGTVNIIFEYNDRFVLAEPLAFDLYDRVDNPTCQTEFVRLHMNDNDGGYHLLFEHINGSFLQRNEIQTGGDMYKIIWYGQGVAGQHQRKGDPEGGHEELLEIVAKLNQTSGEEQWQLIQENFDVNQVAKYFAMNMVISHWDGFFNNYYTYRNPDTGKWQIYAWDQDKTWGYFDSLGEHVDFTTMPITFGMKGDPRPRNAGNFSRSWWRPGGHFSGPMLANPQFREIFLTETKRILDDIYTEKDYYPVIDELAEKLRPEITVRAKIIGESESAALARFDANIASLKRHLKKRREFLLAQDELKSL